VPHLFEREATVTIGTVQVTGHRVRFVVEKTLEQEPNQCELAIYNLNEDHRAALEELEPKKGDKRGIPVRIEAGYKNEASQIWLGDLRNVDSVRDGPDWITIARTGDGEKAFKSGKINVSYGPKTPVDVALRAMVRELGIGEGNVGKVVADLKASGAGKLFADGVVVSGPVARRLSDFAESAELEWSIQDGSLQLLNRGRTLDGQAIQLAPDSGMIGSPTVDNEGLLSVRMLMIPDVRPGSLLVVSSARVRGNYRIEKARWTGDTHGGEWYIDAEAKRF
jgi:hypothetical protein